MYIHNNHTCLYGIWTRVNIVQNTQALCEKKLVHVGDWAKDHVHFRQIFCHIHLPSKSLRSQTLVGKESISQKYKGYECYPIP